MSGLVKAKTYDWKDSNVELFGSDTDRQVKKESAETEPAWEGAGQAVGLKVWRINKFEVEAVEEEDYGEFYTGDSYIVLNTYTKDDSDELLYDVHFWIGESSTQDEYGTAAYKTVELDTFLDDRAVQHREVQGVESNRFLSYFPEFVRLSGGYASGFRHVESQEYQPRLLRLQFEDDKVMSYEVSFVQNSITSDGVFIFDSSSKVVELIGSDVDPTKVYQSNVVFNKISSQRDGAEKIVAREGDSDYGRCKDGLPDEDPEDAADVDLDPVDEPKLFKITDDNVKEQITEGDISVSEFDSNDVYLVHVKKTCFVWIGSGASSKEKKNGLNYASEYLKEAGKPCHRITVLKESVINNATIQDELA
ncbi:severin-like isoform X2 [Ylistrum balloti]|nr:severin-like isoform X2 [Ylistrum balloti]XP_060079432.1 severin-like isoform X2 [Ylistrum balloti]XP_060079433.1 severin-like isoform X2 [Ylistrum balloti]